MKLEKIKIKLTKKIKALIAVIVAVVVIIAGVIVVQMNETAVSTYVLYALMPKTLKAEEINTDYDISVRLSKDFDPKTDDMQPLEAFEYYYTDPETGEEVVIGGTETTEIDGNDVPVYLGFVIKAGMNRNTIKDVMAKVGIVLVILLIAGAIVVWFKIWSKKEDEKKIAFKNNHKKKKK